MYDFLSALYCFINITYETECSYIKNDVNACIKFIYTIYVIILTYWDAAFNSLIEKETPCSHILLYLKNNMKYAILYEKCFS